MGRKPLSVAVEAARLAGRLLLSRYGRLRRSQISMKSKNDFVTEIDRASERLIISVIRKYFPRDAVEGEESGSSPGRQRLWIIDPLDGTSNYIHELPIFSVSIGILKAGHLAAGVIYDPVHQELFTAEKGRGAFVNGRRIRVSGVRHLPDALMATGIPFRARDRFKEYMRSFEAISLGTVGMRRGGSAALDLAYVACGRFDGFWELDLSPWDIAAGAILIEEAGGKITDVWGKKDYLKSGDIVASNGRIHSALCRITSGVFTLRSRPPKSQNS